MIQTKRVYDEPEKTDGFRILVDRLWPRGLTKERAHVDLWLKEIAPSDALRKHFHASEDWREFEKRYRKELKDKTAQLAEIKKLEKEHKRITLLFGRKDEKQNQAVILAEILKGKK
ncbi:MAG TPA: DUF488 family protein [Dongiaceae bacterium]|nr:DUF488 family protein [Dongiaceae bacterium]